MLWDILRSIARKNFSHRARLDTMRTVTDVVEAIRSSSRIMVVTGAGVSVSCGIPDFRSKGGVYDTIAERFELPEPECIFDIHFFRENPEPFFLFAKELFPGRYKPSVSHYFIRLLEIKGKLLRNYTQNIDTLEQEAGIQRALQCHGTQMK